MEHNKTWRESRITIPANEVYGFSQGNTHPNYFMLVNNSATTIYVGINPNVGASSFDIVIPALGCRVYARPDAPGTIYFFTTAESNLYIGSMEIPFDPSMITQTQEIAAVAASGMLGVVDVRAMLNALPAGTNALGTVGVTSLPVLPAGTNPLGSIKVTELPALPAGEVVKPASAPTIYNVTMTTADTEYSQALPAGCKKFTAAIVSQDSIYRVAFATGKVATPTAPYMTKIAGSEYKEDNILLAAGTLYFASSDAGKIMQIIAWV